MDFNEALESVGSFGVYQKLLCVFLVASSAALSTLVYLAQFFTLLVPEHWCRVEQNPFFNGSSEEWKELSIPRTENGFSSCQRYDVNFTSLILEGNPVVADQSWPVTSCFEGWQYDFSSYYPTIATELNWVCEDERLPYDSQLVYYVGTSFGCLIFGHIADKYGRRPSIVLSYFIACLAGILSIFSNSFAAFAALRFFVGFCIIPLSEDPYILSLEYIGVKHRTLGIVIWSLVYIIFSAISPWIAYALGNWEYLIIVVYAPLILFVIFAKFIPESASWLLTNGRQTETIEQLKRVAKVNGNPINETIVFKNELEANEDGDGSNNDEVTMFSLFRMPRLRKHTVLLSFSWFITYCCYHTNVHNTSNLGANVYDSYTYAAFVEAPVVLIILCGIDRFGRRWPMIVALIVAGVSGLLIPVVPRGMPNVFLAIGLVQRLGISTNYNIIMQYSAEIYPTILRGRGVAFLRLMGTFGLFLSPSLVYLSLEDPGMPLMISGIMTLALAGITLFLPETLNQNLPHTLEEGEKFGKDQKIFSFGDFKTRNLNEVEL